MLESQSCDAKRLLHRARILLVEDGPDNRRILSYLLTKAGAEVVAAEDGRRALNLFGAGKEEGLSFDVVLTDMEMPDIDGYELTRKLRLRGETLPIIACTAHSRQADFDLCYEAGCSAHIMKPITPANLLRTIVDALAVAEPSLVAAR